MNEIWKAIPGYEGLYDVSNLGNVRTYYAKGGKTLSDTPTLKTVATIRHNKNYIHLFKEGKEVCVSVSKLVAMAFIPKPKDAITRVKHLDGNAANNRVDNLAWCTK